MMQGIAGIDVASNSELAAAYQVRVAALTKDAIDQAGQEAIKLIESATVAPRQGGQGLDIRV